MSIKFWKLDANDDVTTPSDLDGIETALAEINGGGNISTSNLLGITSPTIVNGQFSLNTSSNAYRMAATLSGTTATIPTPDASQVPVQPQYYCFEMEVSIPSGATSVSTPSGWAWLNGVPTSGFAGKTIYISARFDCSSGARTFLANVWRMA